MFCAVKIYDDLKHKKMITAVGVKNFIYLGSEKY